MKTIIEEELTKILRNSSNSCSSGVKTTKTKSKNLELQKKSRYFLFVLSDDISPDVALSSLSLDNFKIVRGLRKVGLPCKVNLLQEFFCVLLRSFSCE